MSELNTAPLTEEEVDTALAPSYSTEARFKSWVGAQLNGRLREAMRNNKNNSRHFVVEIPAVDVGKACAEQGIDTHDVLAWFPRMSIWRFDIPRLESSTIHRDIFVHRGALVVTLCFDVLSK